jgi:hypothetical protein
MPHAASSSPKMFSRIKDKFSTKKTSTEYEGNSYNYSMGNSNSNTTPSHRGKHPFLDTRKLHPPKLLV